MGILAYIAIALTFMAEPWFALPWYAIGIGWKHGQGHDDILKKMDENKESDASGPCRQDQSRQAAGVR